LSFIIADMKSTSYNPDRLARLLAKDINPKHIPLGAILAMVSTSMFRDLEFYLNTVITRGLSPSDIYEILLQSHLFAGFPRAINSLEIFESLLLKNGIDPSEHFNKEDKDHANKARKGLDLFKKVYGDNSAAVLKTLDSLHPGYDIWILEDAYGRILSRPYLSGKTRELSAVAALTTTGGVKQLQSHIKGAFNLGATLDEVAGAIRSIEDLSDKETIKSALDIAAKSAKAEPDLD